MCIRDRLYHLPYSPDLAPIDFHLFQKLKEVLGGKQMSDDDELKETVTTWFNSQAVGDDGINDFA